MFATLTLPYRYLLNSQEKERESERANEKKNKQFTGLCKVIPLAVSAVLTCVCAFEAEHCEKGKMNDGVK